MIPVKVNYNHFTVYKAWSLNLKIIWKKRSAFSSFFGAANLYDEVTVRGCPYSEKCCHLRLLKWVDENWSLFFIYKWCPVTYKINYYSLFLSRGTIASRLIKWIYKEIGIALTEKKKTTSLITNSLKTTKHWLSWNFMSC